MFRLYQGALCGVGLCLPERNEKGNVEASAKWLSSPQLETAIPFPFLVKHFVTHLLFLDVLVGGSGRAGQQRTAPKFWRPLPLCLWSAPSSTALLLVLVECWGAVAALVALLSALLSERDM